MLQKWSRLYASNINGQCRNKMETERHGEQREREDDVSVSLEKQLYPACLFSIYLTPTHWSVMCVQYLYFCVVSVESKRRFLTDWSVRLVELSMENERRVRFLRWNNLIIIRRQSWPSKYFIVPNSLDKTRHATLSSFSPFSDILSTEQFIL